jgi:TolA-binding protein
MAWLQAQLSFDVEPSEQTLKLIDAVGQTLDGVEEGSRNEIASTTALLQAQTFFALKRDAEALATLTRLRKDFPKSRAAIYSYMTEAEYYAQQQDKIGKAQELLTTLAKDFPDSEYAPYALFRAAAQAEQRQAYDDAERRIEQMITLLEKNPPKDPANNLVFAARMKQGDLLRKLNQFPVAQQVYQNLLNNFSQHPDVILAQLALAECHHAQSASDPSHAERAQVLLKHLNLRLDAPIDVRVEAGCGLGELLVAQGEEQQALEVWWRDVVHAFLDDPAKAASLGATGRFWMGRTLLKMGEILEREQKLEEAKKAWEFVLRTKLPGESVARQQLARYNVAMEGRP